MNPALRGLLWWALMMVGCGAVQSQVRPGTASASAPARSASLPASAASQPGAAIPSPATRAAEGARSPGELRPERPVVPQIAVPLRREPDGERAGAEGAAPRAEGAGSVDESAARCRALKSKADRAACERKRAP